MWPTGRRCVAPLAVLTAVVWPVGPAGGVGPTGGVHTAVATLCAADSGVGGQASTNAGDATTQGGHGCVVIMYGTSTAVFHHTGSLQSFTVPAGVTNLRVHLIGGGGGGVVRADGGNGGGGGYTTGELAVQPGDTYQIVVGGGGRHQCVADHTTNDVATRRNSSFGGGAAGYGAIGFNCTWASGGGRSALRMADQINDLVTAGGGGGGGYLSNGGAGGGLAGRDGGPAHDGRAATGGTQTTGGLGGDGNEPAYDGERHLGGPAGLNTNAPSEGGGGGGGWFGGGGGGNNGGGGGGSSYLGHPNLAEGCTKAGSGRTSGASAPTATSPPTVSGTPALGAVITAASGTWTCHTDRHFQWETSNDGVTWTAVGGATSSAYVIVSTGYVRVVETASHLFAAGTTTSGATAITVDTSLAGLSVSHGTLTPAFSPSVFGYTVAVPHDVTTVSLTPTSSHPGATISVEGESVVSGAPSSPVTLGVGVTTISVLTSNAGLTTTTSVAVERLAPPAPGSAAVPPPPPAIAPSPTTPTTTPVPTTAPPRPPTTPPPPRVPSTTVPPSPVAIAPVPTPQGPLPELQPGSALLIAGARTVTLDTFIEDGTDFVTQLSDRSFGLRVSAQCGTAACPLAVVADGRASLRATPEGNVTVEGFGFRPGTLVHVWIFSNPRFLGSLGVASDGTFLGTLPLGSTPVGEHTLQANGQRSDGVAHSLNLGLIIGSNELPLVRLPATGTHDAFALAMVALLCCIAGLTAVARRRSPVEPRRPT
jgi:hypothetical protein